MLSRIGLAALLWLGPGCGCAASAIDGSFAASGPGPALVIRVNHLGYRPGDGKRALILSRALVRDRFEVIDLDSGRAMFRGRAGRGGGGGWGTFSHVYELDFGAVRRPGRYAVVCGGVRSDPFRVAEGAYDEVPGAVLEFLRQQRCGYNPWLGTNCHSWDGRTAYGPLPAGSEVDAVGGWHDAGDLLKYLLTSGNATAQMLLAHELAVVSGESRDGKNRGRGRHSIGAVAGADAVDARGDPGANGRSDLLDEARWGLEWMLKLHPAPDQLYHQVADDRDHVGFRLPQNETVDYGWGPGRHRVVYAADGRPQGLREYRSESTGLANLAGRYAAAMAMAWQAWHDDPREREFAERCLEAGREVYAMGKRQEGVQQGNSYKAPYRYEERTWADDMEWGAAEMYRATGEVSYCEDAVRYARRAGAESWMGRERAGHYEYYPFLNVGHYRLHGCVDGATRRWLAEQYRIGLAACLEASRENPCGIGVPFLWCSNHLVVALVTQCALYERMTGDRRFRAMAARHRDWLWGRNPWGYSMMTGVGHRYPTEVHLQTTWLTRRSVRGGLVDGPVMGRIFGSLRGVSITEPDPLAMFQDSRAVYHNDLHDYATNEPTLDGTASVLLMWAVDSGAPAFTVARSESVSLPSAGRGITPPARIGL
ncbi:MAG TPA: glycoside hydrolase family 9 protein [Verrucomicrobiota bacterium]|nr:glycoside hydrolase family 9 protein [Verrucomicrobiota bacterium]HNU52132.1 glycoside hydrolase family 9 protein [Verrucomicrobiota bacterium]